MHQAALFGELFPEFVEIPTDGPARGQHDNLGVRQLSHIDRCFAGGRTEWSLSWYVRAAAAGGAITMRSVSDHLPVCLTFRCPPPPVQRRSTLPERVASDPVFSEQIERHLLLLQAGLQYDASPASPHSRDVAGSAKRATEVVGRQVALDRKAPGAATEPAWRAHRLSVARAASWRVAGHFDACRGMLRHGGGCCLH